MKSRWISRTGALAAVASGMLAVTTLSTPASAATWDVFDTDNISRSTPSEKAWTVGSFTWAKDTDSFYTDYRAQFNVDLRLDGAAGSCAHLRIMTYKTPGGTATGSYLSKRFPAAGTTRWGYHTICRSGGRGVATLTGTDVLDSTLGTGQWEFDRADIRVCYTRNSDVPPGTDCYAFTIHPGD